MASIQKAAEKSVKERKRADNVRIKVGHMLTFDHLVHQDIAERQIARKVVRKNIIRAQGCLTLPLTMAYFGFYITAVRLHEDITNVFFLESTLRSRLDDMFVPANTVEDVWDVMTSTQPGKFMDLFFNHYDMYGNLQQRNSTPEVWGDWGIILSYNSIQGAMRFTQTRKSTADYGKAYNCDNAINCGLCKSNEGLQTTDAFTSRPPKDQPCGNWPNPNRRLDEDAEKAAAEEERELTDYLAGDDFHPRRLHMGRVELRPSFPQVQDQKVNDTFKFWLYPSESRADTLTRLNYFKDRAWLDDDTVKLQIQFLLMNPELGRNRLEQVTVNLAFSQAGSVYYERTIECYFLQFFFGNLSMMADGMFFVILLATTAYRVYGMWKAFLMSKLFLHLMSVYTGWEWVMIMIGWWTIYGFYNMMMKWQPALIDALKPVHAQGWALGPDRVHEVEQLFAAGDTAFVGMAGLRVVFAQYSVMLMFRFFFSFGSQPRLAIVLRTMQNVLTDLGHFLIVFLPTAFAYVISGSLIFGRRIESFTTLNGSFGACFRIAMESEYDWADMSAEFFGAAALWAWSFLLLVVLLFLNMVLAIILDIYNETRESSFPGEAIWETVAHFGLKGYRFRQWVPDRTIEAKLGEASDEGMVTAKTLDGDFPRMPESQKQLLFKACKNEMKWESSKDLSKRNLLKLTGSVMDALDLAHKAVSRVVRDEAEDPVASWVTPVEPETKSKKDSKVSEVGSGSHSFLLRPITTKGGKQPLFEKQAPGQTDTYSQSGPEWLREVWGLLGEQRKWIEFTNWNLQQMQWQIQMAVESRQVQLEADGGVGVTGTRIL